MKTPRFLRYPLHACCVLALLIVWPVAAKGSVDLTNAQLIPAEAVPRFGTFFSLHRTNEPPLPFRKPQYIEAGLPVYWLGGNRFLVDDSSLDRAAIEAERQLRLAAAAAQLNAPSPLNVDGAGDPPVLTDSEESTNSLRLTPPVFGGGSMSMGILGAEPEGVYDLYWHSLLGDPAPYIHSARTQPGQTNFLLSAGTSPTGYLLLGTQLDSDGDGIPDAFENLVTKTDPRVANTAESLGTNAWLVQEVTPVVGNSEALEIINRWTDRNPCQGQGTNQGQQAPMLDNFFQTSRWHQAYSGTQTTVSVGLRCVNGSVVTNLSTTVLDWDGSSSEPAKFTWSLTSVDAASNTTSLYWNHNVKRAVITGGLPLSTRTRPWIVHGSATELIPTWDRPLQSSNAIPFGSISMAGQQLDTNGEVAVSLRDNSTNDITPAVTGYTNYAFAAGAERVKLALSFRNIGPVTHRETNDAVTGLGFGYQQDRYDNLTNAIMSTSLGAGNQPMYGAWLNVQETDAFAPHNHLFDSGWRWHRDVFGVRFDYVLPDGDTNGAFTSDVLWSFSSGTAGDMEGNETNLVVVEDNLPDGNRLLILCDAPGIKPKMNYPLGATIVMAYRLFAREWLTWRGALASDVLRWHADITVRRSSSGDWERKGSNLIEQTPAGDNETPTFTREDAYNVTQLP